MGNLSYRQGGYRSKAHFSDIPFHGGYTRQNHPSLHLPKLLLAVMVPVRTSPWTSKDCLLTIRIRALVVCVQLLQLPRIGLTIYQSYERDSSNIRN